AQSPTLATGDFAAFHAEAKRVVATRSGWNSVLVFTPDGQQLVNTAHPWGTPLPRVNEPESLAEVVKTRAPAVGSLALGSVTKRYAFPVRVPIVRDGVVVYVLTAGVRPDALQDLLLRTFPERGEWARAFNDRNGVIVARSREPGRFVGTPGSPRTETFFRDHTVDGADVYVAFSHAP